jgi:hypothetical protein
MALNAAAWERFPRLSERGIARAEIHESEANQVVD